MLRMSLMSFAVVALACAAQAEDKPITERNRTVESAVATPVEDLNIKKTKIPEVLIRAQANPYDVTNATTCDALASEIAAIDVELGDDYDQVAAAGGAGESKGIKAAPLLKAGVANFIPFRGVIRQLSGAAQNEREIEQAIDAGFARRGFLKGKAQEMNCAAPASPVGFIPKPEPEIPAVAQAQAGAPVAAAADVAPPVPTAVPEAATTAPAETGPMARPTVEAAPLPPIPGASEASLLPQQEAAEPGQGVDR
jgi:hypothetical protein